MLLLSLLLLLLLDKDDFSLEEVPSEVLFEANLFLRVTLDSMFGGLSKDGWWLRSRDIHFLLSKMTVQNGFRKSLFLILFYLSIFSKNHSIFLSWLHLILRLVWIRQNTPICLGLWITRLGCVRVQHQQQLAAATFFLFVR